MNNQKCPHCGVKLGNFLYADKCPHCHNELEENTKPLIPIPKPVPSQARVWLNQAWLRLTNFVES